MEFDSYSSNTIMRMIIWARSRNYEGELRVLKMGQISIFVPQLLFSVSNCLPRLSIEFKGDCFTLTYPKVKLHSTLRLKRRTSRTSGDYFSLEAAAVITSLVFFCAGSCAFSHAAAASD